MSPNWRLLAVPLLLLLAGFTFEEATYVYPNGLSLYNDLGRVDPVQVFVFDNGIPSRLENVTINGIPVASFQPKAVNESPVQRDRTGKILALSWFWSEHFDIRFSYHAVQFRLPLNDFQRLQVLGRPKHVDRNKKPPHVHWR